MPTTLLTALLFLTTLVSASANGLTDAPAHSNQVAVGSYHVLTIKNGALYGWGDNTQGQLGLGAVSMEYAPVRIGTDNKWKMVAAANFHSLAIKENGTLWAWGWGNSHEMGLGQATSKTLVPLQVGKDTNWMSVSTAPDNSVALKKDGSLWVWGNNVNAALGVGKTANSSVYTPTRVGKDNDWVKATASQHMILAIKKDGSLWIWGRKGGSSIFGVPAAPDVVTSPQMLGADKDWNHIYVHNRHGFASVVAVKNNGTCWGWGSNKSGKLGPGHKEDMATPVALPLPTPVASMAIDNNHSIVVKEDGSLWHAGSFLKNIAVKSNETTQSVSFIPLRIDGKWAAVYKGMNFTLLLDKQGQFWTFGTNDKGQLGNGYKNSSAAPTKVAFP
jgi:alpha-tubulin suppressor-like RCC1 family protein